MAEDTAKALTPSHIEIAYAKIRSIIRSIIRPYWEDKFWMERRLHRYPIVGFVSEWDMARARTTLASACGLALGTGIYSLFLQPRPEAVILNQPPPLATQVSDHPLPEPPVQILKETTTQNAEAKAEIPKIVQEIANQVSVFSEEKESNERVLAWKGIVKDVTGDPRLRISATDRVFWTNRMLAIIKVESNGLAKVTGTPATSTSSLQVVDEDEIGMGLTQITPKTARQVALKYQIPEYDLLKPWDNVFIGLAYELELANMFGKDLAGWAYHIGMGRMDKVTRMQSETPPQQLTTQKLLENPEMMAKLTKLGAFEEDKEGKYPIRLAAAEIVLGS